MRGLFVTGTGTGVGKTILSASLLAAMAAGGERVRAHKPVVTGIDDRSQTGWPADHELLASVAGMRPEDVAPLRYGPAVSPHLAARLAGDENDPAGLITRARAAGTGGGTLIVEGVGGLLVPLTEDFTVRDLAAALGLPVVIAAGPGLGTINHTLLTIDAARTAGLDLRAVVLTPWTDTPAEMECSNRDTIARLGEIEVVGLGHVPSPSVNDLARTGGEIPWRHWCPPESFVPSDA
jgi:dethiobiotin synthetase